MRQRLLSKNQFKKYFLYAVGEITLVVIGILIALQFNNWNESKKEKQKEKAFLTEINLDFKSNKNQLDSIIAYNKVSLHAGKRLVVLLRNFDFRNPVFDKTNSNDSIAYYSRLIWRNKSYNPKNGSVEALLSSSSFDLIQNDKLRRNLISWKDVLGDYLEEENFAVNFLFNEYGPWARKNFEPDLNDDTENAKVFLSKQHRNFIYHRIGDLGNMINAAKSEGIVDMIEEIIQLTELKSND